MSLSSKEPPRLTGFIRAFSDLSFKYEGKNSFKIPTYAELKRKRAQETSQLSWKQLSDFLLTECRHPKDDVQRYRKLIIEVVGNDSTEEQLDQACISFFRDLGPVEKVNLEHVKGYKLQFGTISYGQVEKMHKLVQQMYPDLSEALLGKLNSNWDIVRIKESKNYFGAKYKFQKVDSLADERELAYLQDVKPTSVSLHDQITFSFNSDHLQGAGSRDCDHSNEASTAWLETMIATHYQENPLGMSVPEFAATIVEKLSSKKQIEELQTELFDLCGFEQFDLITAILEKRDQIVRSHKKNVKAMKSEIAQVASAVAAQKPSMPTYGSQVTVQSGEERKLIRQMRREEKKLYKATGGPVSEDNNGDNSLDFNPAELRLKRQAALNQAKNQPLFKERSAVRELQDSIPKETYPFVFDSLSAAKLTTGYVQGNKMSLPAGFERKDKPKFEEVTVPASTFAGKAETGRKLVAVADMDEIGRLAFQGIKNLNKIQSVVYDCAYKTSENMLVCAPTGAGKTNVAMLTVVQAIKQHIENGVIKKDKFKIVYVAPMKALAAEMAMGFGKRLAPLGLTVKELTGDMQLTKSEIANTQMLITTPEKWDVVTRKTGDVGLSALVRLLIIDEVHLLHGDRGPVVESIVARTLRLVESSQTVIRVVGLSATLPNYIDVAKFLRVNPFLGLFFFDGRFRPVPLAQTFIGVKQVNPMKQKQDMEEICYEKVIDFVKAGHQVMVFVHARNATVNTAMLMKETAQQNGEISLFQPAESIQLKQAKTSVQNSRNRQLQELFAAGFGIHHAGMLRSDRNLVEKYFSQGLIKVLVCTATLAWGVNLPAHAVIIKGTEIYDSKHGAFVDVGILDVLQIFGRAGRPQFDSSGHGTIITSYDKLSHYLSLLTNQFPIESNFIGQMTDNLNAEISLGTVTNIDEAITWLSYTYLYVRMRKNPQIYGIKYQELQEDPTLEKKRREIIIDAAQSLDKAQMVRFDQTNGYMSSTNLGRTASHFYIKYDTVEIFNELFKPFMNESDILSMISQAQEFQQLKVRDDEMGELDEAQSDYAELPVKGGVENVHGKVNLLLQIFISRGRVKSFSLVSDMTYITQNASRIARALFEIVLRRNLPLLSGRMLKFAKCIERQMWDFEHPLKQHPLLKPEIVAKFDNRNITLDKLRELTGRDIGQLIHNVHAGAKVRKAAEEIPLLDIEVTIQPITRTVLRVRLTIAANFRWNDQVHGRTAEPFWIWVEDPSNDHMYHHEYFLITRKQVMTKEPQELCFTIPIFDPLPSQYYVRAISDRWLGSESTVAISFKHLILPERHPPNTDLLDLQPLPVTALNDPQYERLYPFTHFNPIQTQVFHTLYHTDRNVLLGAPTGSGKTIVAEMAILRVFRTQPKAKVVYIAPLKALVRERIEDWKVKLGRHLGKSVVELTGDVTPDARAIARSSVIITTPEKWDGVSRSWQTRDFVRDVALIVIDEIHLLGEDRGPVLEVIVSRTNFISGHTDRKIRLIGLSTALANARDLADWLGIGQCGLFNFRPSVRPVPLECHIAGFPGKHYCPRMATMNKPVFQYIKQHSPEKPVLIFVSSRRQTRMTALDLIAFLAGEENPKQWLHMSDGEMDGICSTIRDQNLRLTLAFGIGIHHAGLVEHDRKTVEELYTFRKIQVMIATSTLAWGVNFPTHLVVVKGTEYYDGKLKRYVDMPITDVLQMIGRAGRPQYDDQGVACVLVHDVKKGFYKKFLYEPFPVESCLLAVLSDHLNAEIVAGTIQSRQDAIDYMTWTYFFRRLVQNPTYYGMDGVEQEDLNSFLTGIVGKAIDQLAMSYCLEIDEDGRAIYPTTLGRISSFYYLAHQTLQHFRDNLGPELSTQEVIQVLVDSTEFSQLPVRHNEDLLNTELAKTCPLEVNQYTMDSPHTKAHLLLQCHFSRLPLPCTDYSTDSKSVFDNALRVMQAMIDVCAESGWLAVTLRAITLLQMSIQARWDTDNCFLVLPHFEMSMVPLLAPLQVRCLPELIYKVGTNYEMLAKLLRNDLEEPQIEDVWAALSRYPRLKVSIQVGTETVNLSPSVRPADRVWTKVTVGEQVPVTVYLTRQNRFGKEGTKAYAPKFPKPKDEGWVLVAGIPERRELIALKRAGTIAGRTKHTLLVVPEKAGRWIYTVYIMSDCYLGLDQQYDIFLDVEGAQEDEIFYSDEEEMPTGNYCERIDQDDDQMGSMVSMEPVSDWNQECDAASWQ